MIEKFSRAQRRHDYARVKTKRQYHWGYGRKHEWRGRPPKEGGEIDFMTPRVSGLIANTVKPNQCYCCCNPRHTGYTSELGRLTLQEYKALLSYVSQLGEYYGKEDTQ